MPGRLIRARLSARRDPDTISDALISDQRRDFRGGLLVAVAPGERDGLTELIESVRRFEGDDIKIVVSDDLTGEYTDQLVRREFPGVDFVRPRIPAGSRYCAFRTLQAGLLHMLDTYRVETILKADPDSLIVASGAFDRAAERFRSDPRLGVLGTTELDAAGHTTDYRWASWMAHPELRWSRRFRRLVRRAEARFPQLNFAQAGAYFLSGAAARTALAAGLLQYRQPQWSLQVDDVVMDLIIQAAGFRVDSFGGPGDPIASDTDRLPLEPADLLRSGFKVVHSVRGTPSGMPEEAVREFFREARAP